MAGPPTGEAADQTAFQAARATNGAADFFSLGELKLTVIILFFGLVAIAMYYMLLRHEKATPYALRIFVIIILIFGTLLVVSSAYSTDQIAPVVGFFGTIAGYLLGRTERNNDETP